MLHGVRPTRLVLLALAWSVTACGLVVSFDEYDSDGRRAVRGIVEGLEGSTVTLLLNGEQAIEVGNGPFAFPGARPGTSYSVTVQGDPPGHMCSVVAGTGKISRDDVTDVVVRCPSTDATLIELSLSNAALSPPFVPWLDARYSASPMHATILAGGPATIVTARTRSPSARITIGGLTLGSGVPTSVPLTLGRRALDIDVTAASGAQAHTFVDTIVKPSVYFKASNTHETLYFGWAVALDGDTLAVGAFGDSSNATGVNGDQTDKSLLKAGAVYVFSRTGEVWSQQAYIKPPNPKENGYFGAAVALSGDTLAVGAYGESSNAKGIGGNPYDISATNAGAVYVFTRTAGVWSQQAYIKASNSRAYSLFGYSLALSGDTLVVGGIGDKSNAKGVGGDENDASLQGAGAAYVFERAAGTWVQKAYLKASNTRSDAVFGSSVALSGDQIVVGAPGESSAAKVVDGNQNDTSAVRAGAAYVFARSGATWAQRAYLKASNARADSEFGRAVAISGATVLVGAPMESSAATTIDGDQSDTSAVRAGAAYVFVRTGDVWSQQAYLKASNTRAEAQFGAAVGLEGDVAVASAPGESGAAQGIDGDPTKLTAARSGAAYVLRRTSAVWTQAHYLKASNAAAGARFGYSLSLRGQALLVSADLEASGATGVNGDEDDTSAGYSGAAYLF